MGNFLKKMKTSLGDDAKLAAEDYTINKLKLEEENCEVFKYSDDDHPYISVQEEEGGEFFDHVLDDAITGGDDVFDFNLE